MGKGVAGAGGPDCECKDKKNNLSATILYLCSMGSFETELKAYKHVFAVCDRNVEDFARELVGGTVPILPIDASENTKTMETVVGICRWLLEKGADRDALVLAIGGGVTTDMTGFAACIYKRGVRYANVPTTLLAQVDAAVGGKTGVNLDSYKNLLGIIRQPEFTAIFPEALATLPERELRSGAAEMLKTFIISNPDNSYERAVALLSRCRAENRSPLDNAADAAELAELIKNASGVKQAIVEEDEFESGPRRKLNLGHTWGHAIEWWQRTHGAGEGDLKKI